MTKYEPFIKWLECTCGKNDKNGIIKLFARPWKKLASDGMPAKKYRWLCNFEVSGANREKMLLHSTMKPPPRGSLKVCMEKARQLGIREFTIQRLKNGELLVRKYLI